MINAGRRDVDDIAAGLPRAVEVELAVAVEGNPGGGHGGGVESCGQRRAGSEGHRVGDEGHAQVVE